MRKAAKRTIVTLLLLTLGISTAFLIYLHFFVSDDQNLTGEWTADLDMSRQAAVTALIWMQDIDGVSVSLEDMEAYMQELFLPVNLSFEQTAHDKGSFICSILPESYDDCEQAAYEALAAAFREVLTERLHMAGYVESADEEDIEALVTETFGMSTVSYLMTCGPRLLPSLEELQEQFEGSGTYEISGNILTRHFFNEQIIETKEEYYIRNDSCLILSGETDFGSADLISEQYPLLYTLKQP